jgi:hypothetical protein
MKIIHDPRRPNVLIARPRNPALAGAIVMSAFGCLALVGGIHTVVTQAPVYRVYALILVLIAVACIVCGLPVLFRRTQYSFDGATRTITIERKGAVRTTRHTNSSDAITAVVLVRYWYFNRLARSETDYWYRLQLHGPRGAIYRLAPKLRETLAFEVANAIASFLKVPLELQAASAQGVVTDP